MKKTLALFSLTCCKGCLGEGFELSLDLMEITNFYHLSTPNSPEDDWTTFDIGLVEGNPENEDQIKLLHKIRKYCKTVIALGACANLGGVQSQRDYQPKKLIHKERVKTVSEIIKVDCSIPGCPINKDELNRCLMDLYWGKKFLLSDLPVCFECRQKNNDCFLRDLKPCLGPITRGGCQSVCIDHGQSCFGCRGRIADPNVEKLEEILHPSESENEINNLLLFYGEDRKK